MELSSSNVKIILIFQKWSPALFSPSSKNKKIHPEKITYTSGNENPGKNFCILSKGIVLMFRETENLKNLFTFQET